MRLLRIGVDPPAEVAFGADDLPYPRPSDVVEAEIERLDVAMEAFGSSRVMFGSDRPVCLPAATYAEVHMAAEELSPAERAEVFGVTAARAYCPAEVGA